MEKRVDVEIFGETYHLKTDNDEAYTKKLAALVDGEMRKIAQRSYTLSNVRVGVLAALTIADSYYKMKKDYDELVELIGRKG